MRPLTAQEPALIAAGQEDAEESARKVGYAFVGLSAAGYIVCQPQSAWDSPEVLFISAGLAQYAPMVF